MYSWPVLSRNPRCSFRHTEAGECGISRWVTFVNICWEAVLRVCSIPVCYWQKNKMIIMGLCSMFQNVLWLNEICLLPVLLSTTFHYLFFMALSCQMLIFVTIKQIKIGHSSSYSVEFNFLPQIFIKFSWNYGIIQALASCHLTLVFLNLGQLYIFTLV